MKATGHTQVKTYQRYIKTDEDVARLTGEALARMEAATPPEALNELPTASEMIN